MFLHHPHGKRATNARAADFHLHQIAHLRAVRLAAEIAILVAALVFWGLLHIGPTRPSLPESGAAENCVHFGRAGGHCATGAAIGVEKSDAEPKCLLLGRAGRFCPSSSP